MGNIIHLGICMHPIKHVILTVLLFFSIRLFYNLELNVLMYSIILTLLFDIVDHSIILLLVKTSVTDRTKTLIKKGKFIEAFSWYYNSRRGNFDYLYLHNLLFFIAVTFVAFYYMNFMLIIGIVFHMVTDMIECYQKNNLNFWIYGWKKLIKLG
jgi:hypothetical protein